MHVGVDAGLVSLEGGPIDIAEMMFTQKHRPLGHGLKTISLAQPSLVIDVLFSMMVSVGARASIHRIGEYGVDGGVSYTVGWSMEVEKLAALPMPY
jgi:hypothetical protein